VQRRKRSKAAAPSPKTRTRPGPAPLTKLAQLEAALSTKTDATIPDLMAITDWQAHSVRGALAGALKKRGLAIISERINGERRYRVARWALRLTRRAGWKRRSGKRSSS
jgi:hypothetical protein